MSRLEGRPVVRSPEQLRLHRGLEELGWTGVTEEFNDAARLKNQSAPDPILITTIGTILAGFGRWRLSVFERRHEIHCIEYPLSEDESLQFIITHHQTRCEWNDFVGIRLAQTLESNLQQRAHDNMSAGGKYKGSANLLEAYRIDVREEIARIAAVGRQELYRWSRDEDKLGERAFPGVGQKRTEETRIAELERKIGQQVLEIDFLKRDGVRAAAASARIGASFRSGGAVCQPGLRRFVGDARSAHQHVAPRQSLGQRDL
jgi:hypothetical protein